MTTAAVSLFRSLLIYSICVPLALGLVIRHLEYECRTVLSSGPATGLAAAGVDQFVDCLRWLYFESGAQVSSRAGTGEAAGSDRPYHIGDRQIYRWLRPAVPGQ